MKSAMLCVGLCASFNLNTSKQINVEAVFGGVYAFFILQLIPVLQFGKTFSFENVLYSSLERSD